MSLALNEIVQRSPDTLAADIDREVIILDVQDSRYLCLNDIAAEIWRSIEAPTSVADLCARLHADFDVPATVIDADVMAFLDRLDAKGFLARSSAP